MKPILIIPPDLMADTEIKELRDNGLCVVTASDPSKVKFIDSIPNVMNRTNAEQAAIHISRKLLNPTIFTHTSNDGEKLVSKREVWKLFMEAVIKGTPLDPSPTTQEIEEKIISDERRDELRKIAREEAREEAAKRKKDRTMSKANNNQK